jgi:hypothetical protein
MNARGTLVLTLSVASIVLAAQSIAQQAQPA